MNIAPNPIDSLTENSPDAPAPSSAYAYSTATFVTVLTLFLIPLSYLPVRLTAFLGIAPVVIRTIGIMAGLALAITAGTQTWNRCVRANAARVKFDSKRERLREQYGPGKRTS